MEKIANSTAPNISVSVVSHGQMDLISRLLQDIQSHCQGTNLELILTLNIEESENIHADGFFYPIKIIRNKTAKGFGSNHNQAFGLSTGSHFCIVNPDIRFDHNPFHDLLRCLENARIGVVAPLVTGPDGQVEDSARRFPTPIKILDKALGRSNPNDYAFADVPLNVDWVGGMFMMFPRHVFESISGFDERFFLYYEDVDICARLNLMELHVALCPGTRVEHHAQRSSHRSLKYMRWHLASMARFFASPVYWRLKRLNRL